jgi:hypothetical protein
VPRDGPPWYRYRVKATWLAVVGTAACTGSSTELSPRLQAVIGDNLPQGARMSLVDRFYKNATATAPVGLDSGIRVDATVGSTTLPQMRSDGFFLFPSAAGIPPLTGPVYLADMAAPAPGSVVTFAVAGTSSSTTIPADFTLAPVPDGTSRSAPLVITWTPVSTDMVTAELSGDCLVTSGDPNEPAAAVPDTGTWTFPASAMQASCEGPITVTVLRRHAGALDTAFPTSGVVEAVQYRQTYFRPGA